MAKRTVAYVVPQAGQHEHHVVRWIEPEIRLRIANAVDERPRQVCDADAVFEARVHSTGVDVACDAELLQAAQPLKVRCVHAPGYSRRKVHEIVDPIDDRASLGHVFSWPTQDDGQCA
jgi:hypothetical protein